MRLANDVDSLLRTQLTWTSTQTTINSLSEQVEQYIVMLLLCSIRCVGQNLIILAACSLPSVSFGIFSLNIEL